MNVDVVNFIDLLIKFQGTDRHIPIPSLNRVENDTEHSYNLAMTAWLIIAADKLPLSLDLVIRYALVHDLVEVYATDAFALDDKQVAQKEEKEHAALNKLEKNGLTKEFVELIRQYEKLEDEESKFVYGLDKLMPAFTLIHGKVGLWKEHNVSLQAWDEKFRSKIEMSRYLTPYLDQLIKLQKDNPALLAN
jgi:putative hydrolase of HD superfamily